MKSVRALYGMVLQRGLQYERCLFCLLVFYAIQYERVLHLGVTESE